MKRKNIYKLLFGCLLFTCLMACTKKDTPEPLWKYAGPVPEIIDGPAMAQKMCYALWQKYDVHVYYNLSGEEALKTEVGQTQINGIIYNNAAAIPIQAADEIVAEKFLELLTGFFSLLPDDMVSHGLHRRHVLVKINPGKNNRYKDAAGNTFFVNTYTEDQQGIIYYGYLNDEEDTDDKFISDLTGWKWNICYEFFGGLSYTPYKGIALPERFSAVSKKLYVSENAVEDKDNKVESCIKGDVFNRDLGKLYGFVSPFGAMANSDFAYADWKSFVAWILTESLSERQTDLEKYPKVLEKYKLVLKYYQDYYKLDMEKVAAGWQEIKIN